MSYGKPLQVGEKYGRLTVERYLHTDDHPRRYFLCRCECGGEVATHTNALRTGNTRSCGCLGRELRKAKRLPNNASVINHIILQYKRHARNRGIEFLLTRCEVDAIVRLPCHYCGIEGGNLKRTKNCPEGFSHNGIDRVDSALPYIAANVVPCCGVCNIAKGARTRPEFLSWVARIMRHQLVPKHMGAA